MAFGGFVSQTEAYWRDTYQVSVEDLDLIETMALKAGKPIGVMDIAGQIVLRRYNQEKDEASRRSGSGVVYRPMDTHQVADRLVFSALDMRSGNVVSLRPGTNPKYGAFQVVRVAWDDGGAEREFAAGFDHPHPLNRPVEELLVAEDVALSEEEMVRVFGAYVAAKLEKELASHDDYVRFGQRWFLSALLPEIHVGYLNLAEAMIYEAQRPVSATEMLPDLGLESGSPEAQLFALNRALGRDERFDGMVSPVGMTWYLRALMPAEAFELPPVLTPLHRARGGELVGLTLLDVIEALGDELDDVDETPLHAVSEARCELIFPHLYAGTLPAGTDVLYLLKDVTADHMPVTLVSENGRDRLVCWLVRKHSYLCGLKEWYVAQDVGVGAIVTLSPTDEPNVLRIAVASSRSNRSQWLRAAGVVDGELDMQMQRATVSVRCDPNTLVLTPEMESLAALVLEGAQKKRSIAGLVHRAFAECAKLNSRGLVHAKSVYSVINLIGRASAVAVFAELTRRACYDPVGDGFWAYDAALQAQSYGTPGEMRERPLSTREDLLRDQVVEYRGR